MILANRLRTAVQWVVGETNKSQQEVGEILGYPNSSYFSQILSGRKPIAASLGDKLCALDPRINPDFLTGESNVMLIGGEEAAPAPADLTQSAGAGDLPTRTARPAKSAGIFVPAELAQMVTDLTATVREQQRIIGTMVDAWAKGKEGEK